MSKKSSATGNPTPAPSSNWLALQKVLPKPAATRKRGDSGEFPRKRRKVEHERSPSPVPLPRQPAPAPETSEDAGAGGAELKNGESLPALRKMIFGHMEYTEAQRQPGKFLALDCEMVGVGPEGAESALARVSLVNYYGAVQLDAFVRPRERVVDYRTEWSGVREADMVHAKPFEEVQRQVADLLKDRVLVGHAVFNDLKVLLLSHPRPLTRDTQHYAGKFKVAKSKYVALRNLVKQELGAAIQGGEHSSVTDARATMAVYRLHRREWEKGAPPLARLLGKGKGKKHAGDEEEESGDSDEEEPALPTKKKGKESKKEGFPGGGRKGVSSGLGTIVRRAGGSGAGGVRSKSGGGGGEKTQWWTELGGASAGSKGRLSAL
ncbi:ribonuclease H-like domain-containing protein [Mycena latifolia]|nr:ribonuclease H-like domain-containing protein [Mycena latifolia]